MPSYLQENRMTVGLALLSAMGSWFLLCRRGRFRWCAVQATPHYCNLHVLAHEQLWDWSTREAASIFTEDPAASIMQYIRDQNSLPVVHVASAIASFIDYDIQHKHRYWYWLGSLLGSYFLGQVQSHTFARSEHLHIQFRCRYWNSVSFLIVIFSIDTILTTTTSYQRLLGISIVQGFIYFSVSGEEDSNLKKAFVHDIYSYT